MYSSISIHRPTKEKKKIKNLYSQTGFRFSKERIFILNFFFFVFGRWSSYVSHCRIALIYSENGFSFYHIHREHNVFSGLFVCDCVCARACDARCSKNLNALRSKNWLNPVRGFYAFVFIKTIFNGYCVRVKLYACLNEFVALLVWPVTIKFECDSKLMYSACSVYVPHMPSTILLLLHPGPVKRWKIECSNRNIYKYNLYSGLWRVFGSC